MVVRHVLALLPHGCHCFSHLRKARVVLDANGTRCSRSHRLGTLPASPTVIVATDEHHTTSLTMEMEKKNSLLPSSQSTVSRRKTRAKLRSSSREASSRLGAVQRIIRGAGRRQELFSKTLLSMVHERARAWQKASECFVEV